MQRQCKGCQQIQSIENFYFSGSRTSRRYRLYKCKTCIVRHQLEIRKIKYSGSWYRLKYEYAKRRAKRKGATFELTIDEYKNLIEQIKCFYCESKISWSDKKDWSIDRLDNKLGYKYSNCVAACKSCNTRKSNVYTVQEMKIIGQAIKNLRVINPAIIIHCTIQKRQVKTP